MSLEVSTGKSSEPGTTTNTAEERPNSKKATTNPGKKAPAKSTTKAKSTSAKTSSVTEAENAETVPVPEGPPAPFQPVEDGLVQVTQRAKEGEIADPSGNVTEQKKRTVAKPKSSPFKNIDTTKLPVAAQVGQVQAAVRLHAGAPILAVGLVGWIGEESVIIPAEDANDIEAAIAELGKLLS